jgi:hypothetical protein
VAVDSLNRRKLRIICAACVCHLALCYPRIQRPLKPSDHLVLKVLVGGLPLDTFSAWLFTLRAALLYLGILVRRSFIETLQSRTQFAKALDILQGGSVALGGGSH